MKTKKTLKRLNKVVALLSNVIDQLPGSNKDLGDLLNSAKVTVAQAANTLNAQPSNEEAKSKRPAKAEKTGQRRLSEEGRKRISLAAKKRWEAARRKGVNPVSGRRLSKT
jgi:septal ring factor EnvC (AmiA/AmiB activator)